MNISEFKKSVLEKAISGNLVSQIESEGTGVDLLKELYRSKKKDSFIIEKDEGYIEGVVNGAQQPVEVPFAIPKSWSWVKLNDIATVLRGGSPRPIKNFITEKPDGINWIKIGDTEKGGKYITSTKEKIIKEGLSKTRQVKPGDFLLTNSMSFGRPYILKINGAIHDGWLVISDYEDYIDQDFLYYFLSSDFVYNQFKLMASGTGVDNLNADKVKSLFIPILPLAEQKRIVEEVEKVFKFADLVGRRQQLDEKFKVDMKKSLLDMAIRGQLVPQIESEGTDMDLLKELYQSKKKDSFIIEKDEGYIEELANGAQQSAEVPFEIPKSWSWVKLNDIATVLRGGSPRPIKNFITEKPDGINWIKIGDAEKGSKYITSTKEKIIKEGLSKTRQVKPGDFLLTNSMSFGRPYILKIDGAIHDGWLVISDYEDYIDQDFLYYFLSSDFVYNQFKLMASGTGVDNLNADKVKSLFIPIPPLAEQKRIVAIYERLISRLS